MHCSQSRGSPPDPWRQHGVSPDPPAPGAGEELRDTGNPGARLLARAPGDFRDRGGPGEVQGGSAEPVLPDVNRAALGKADVRRQRQPCRRALSRISPAPPARVPAWQLAGARRPASLGWHHRATHCRPAPPGLGTPLPGSLQGLCKQGGFNGTGAQAAAPHPAAQPLASGTLVSFVPLGLGLVPPL